jgi:glutamyl-tRNA synthetase
MPFSKETKALIRKYAIKNAMDYGKAQAGNVLGKVARSVPKGEVDALKALVNEVVKEVNSLPKGELLKEYEAYEDEFIAQYERKVEATSKPRMVLDGAVEGSFATRFPPEPSGYMHIGHAHIAFLAREFANIYKGQAFLYFDDTDPEKESQEFVDSFKRDLGWLGIKFDKEYYASDSIEKLYEYAKVLIKEGKAYACECPGEETKKNRFAGIECIHRNAPSGESAKKFEMMLANKYDEEKISIRFRGDMKSDNTALRDPTIMRIKRAPHYRQGNKYVVWPTYDFNTPINDSMNGVTDAIRTNEFALRDELYNAILDSLKLRKPRLHLHARLPIKGNISGKRELNRLIKEGYIKGYDDPRLTTIIALRRRGIQPEAIQKFVLGFGMSKSESSVDLTALLAYNKKIIDRHAKRLYYVSAPVDIELKDFDKVETDIPLHPSEDMGSRKSTLKERVYITGDDASQLKDGDVVKLKGAFCIRVSREEDSWTGRMVLLESEAGIKVIQWISDGGYLKCSVLMPEAPLDDDGNFRKDSLKKNNGYIEEYASNLKKGEIVQLERFGFCILDDKENMQFIFISK